MAQVLIAGRNYSGVDLKVIWLGVPLLQVATVRIEKRKNRTFEKGLGAKDAVAYVEGDNDYEGELTLTEDDLKAIRQAIKNAGELSGSVTEVAPSTLLLSFANPSSGLQTVKVFNVLATADGYEVMIAGSRKTRIPFLASGIEF